MQGYERINHLVGVVAGRTSAAQSAWSFEQNSSSELQRTKRAVRACLASPHEEVDHVIVASSARSGTNLLCGTFFQFPDTLSSYEVLNAAHKRSVRFVRSPAALSSYLRHSARGLGAKVVVSKIFDAHLVNSGLGWDDVRAAKPAAVIHLRRDDLLAQFVSGRAASRSGVWVQSVDGKADNTKVHVDIAEFRSFRDAQVDAWHAVDRSLSATNRYENLFYEDLVPDPIGFVDGFMRRTFGMERGERDEIDIWSKTPTRELADRVVNWGEVAAIPDNERYLRSRLGGALRD